MGWSSNNLLMQCAGVLQLAWYLDLIWTQPEAKNCAGDEWNRVLQGSPPTQPSKPSMPGAEKWISED
ncbi:hypothetical protein BS47DRAFT_1352118 [Hydnum rufescens UP504]|uniref:Uncharacterized protein n=1 Tax=Hydnum rufescens UP504 TaxID=1448309 RepID=A0A9P6AJJ6_9AGAM|nr:hypothetical protein BS47DRAFT_1352118 [Hydnum rufescens UP504]